MRSKRVYLSYVCRVIAGLKLFPDEDLLRIILYLNLDLSVTKTQLQSCNVKKNSFPQKGL